MMGMLGTAVASSQDVPNWIKQVAKFWSDDLISDSEFLSAIEYLVQNKFIVIGDDGGLVQQEQQKQQHDSAVVKETDMQPTKLDIASDVSYIDFLRMLLHSDDLTDEVLLDRAEIMLEDELFDRIDVMTGEELLDRIDLMPEGELEYELQDVSYNELVRYNDQYVGEDLFFLGTVREVTDKTDSPNSYELLVDVSEINFDKMDADSFIVVNYVGSRLLFDDKIRIAGTIVGLEIRDIVNLDYSSTKRIESGDGDVVERFTTGAGTQTYLPVITTSYIQMLKDPKKMYLDESDSIAMRIPYDQLDEHNVVLEGSVVYYEGTVSAVMRSGEELSGFNVDVNPNVQYFDAVQFNVEEDIEDLTKYDTVRVHGVVTSTISNIGYPVINATHVKIIDDKN